MPSLEVTQTDTSNLGTTLDFFASIVGSVAWPIAVLLILTVFKSQVKQIADGFSKQIANLRSMKGAGVEVEWSDKKAEQLADKVNENHAADTLVTEEEPEEAKTPSIPATPTEGPSPNTAESSDLPRTERAEKTSSATSTNPQTHSKRQLGLQRRPMDPLDVAAETAIKLARVATFAGVIAAFIELEREIGFLLEARGVSWKGTPIMGMRNSDVVPRNTQMLVREMSQLRNAAAHGDADISLNAAIAYINSAITLAKDIRNLTANGRVTD